MIGREKIIIDEVFKISECSDINYQEYIKLS